MSESLLDWSYQWRRGLRGLKGGAIETARLSGVVVGGGRLGRGLLIRRTDDDGSGGGFVDRG